MRTDAARIGGIEAEKELLAVDDGRRVGLSQEATDIAERLAIETSVEEMLAREVAEASGPEE